MTFTEAALEVLQRLGREMHAREIADKAVEWDLLSHVGKTPVQTMSARISAVVAKGPGKGPFVRVRPGVFALASWGGKPPGPSKEHLADKSTGIEGPAKKETPDEKEKGAEKKGNRPRRKPKDADKKEKGPEKKGKDAGGKAKDADKKARAPEKKAEPRPVSEDGQEPPKKRKRRRRKKKGEEPQEQAQPGTARPQDERRKPDGEQPQGAKKGPRDQGANGKKGSDDEEVSDRVEAYMRSHTRPVPINDLAARFGYDGRDGVSLLETILIADGLDREYRGLRPRFVQHRSGWALAEREVSSEIVSLERQVKESVERLGIIAERQMLRKLRNLPMPLFARVVTLYLKRAGFGELTPVHMGSSDEIHMAVQDRRRGGRFQTAVVIRKDNGDKALSDDVVVALRGSLHRYRSMRGMMITTGVFDEKARTEAVIPNLPPVALIDGEVLARELVRLGIGVRERRVNMPTFDESFFGALGG